MVKSLKCGPALAFRFGIGILGIGVIGLGPVHAVTPAQADSAAQAFNKVYWNASGKYFYKNDNKTGVLDFWLSAHSWETIMDVYVRTGKAEYKQQIKDVYDGFIARHSADWTKNDYNDDIAWWVIASARAYALTGEARYLTQAKSQFDWVYNTQRDTVLGGIWWRNDAHNEKNSCVVQPMIISAAMLAKHLKDDTYRVKAESLYAWQRRTLVEANTGKVFDNIKVSGAKSTGSTTYNQGTWIGSGVLLGHLADAKLCADWTKKNLCNAAGVLRETGQGDFGAFKMILTRYVIGLSKVPGNEAYAQWMETNANAVWGNRRADGLMGHDWNAPAPTTGLQAQSSAGGVSLLNLLLPSSVGLRPLAARSRIHSGSGKAFLALQAGTAANWVFSQDPVSGMAGAGEAAFPGVLRAVNGRIQR